ncbi:MAG: LUD domain-containing protein [Acidobacteriaceae bacterium]|nr:LUD domain-containing protein [Acidobacteriaceae bacterium]
MSPANKSRNSRENVLGKIGKATASVALDASAPANAYANLPRPYIRKGSMPSEAKIELLIERLREYDAEVVECSPAQLVDSIHKVISASGHHSLVAPPELPAAWMTPGVEWKLDRGMSDDEIEKTDGVVTAAFCAIADSGTIVLHHSTSEGRRVITLLPDWHLCILYASQVVETLPEYFARAEQQPALVTWISGPSATADIEMTRIKGVHGPRYLNVILVHDEA